MSFSGLNNDIKTLKTEALLVCRRKCRAQHLKILFSCWLGHHLGDWNLRRSIFIQGLTEIIPHKRHSWTGTLGEHTWSRRLHVEETAMSASTKTTTQPLLALSMSASSFSRAHILCAQAMDPAQSNSPLVFEPSPTPHIPYPSTTTPTTPYPLPTTLIKYTHLSSYNLPHRYNL